jgi:hypothetical protein
MYYIKFLKDVELEAVSLIDFSKKIEKFEKNKRYKTTDIAAINLGRGDKRVCVNAGVPDVDFKAYKILGAKEFYKDIARAFIAWNNCIKSKNSEQEEKHATNIEELVKTYLPRGSGFDNGTYFNWDESSENKLVFDTAFHHMNEGGYYDGWTEHKVIVRPCLSFGFNIKVTGRNRNDIKEYIHSCFDCFEYTPEARHYGN